MRLAILGTDPDMLRLAAAARSEGHELVWFGDIRPADAASIACLASNHPDQSTNWELLLDRAFADAVLVGRGTASTDLRSEQLKRLATEAMPMLIVHPIFDSVLPYYEVDMARRETGGVVRHYNPLAGHPILGELAQWVRDGHPLVGRIHQISCERCVADPSRSNVLANLARDVEFIAAIAGDIRRVSAIGPVTTDESFASLQIQMKTTSVASLRWSVGSAATAGRGLVATFLGEDGTICLRVADPDAGGEFTPWHLEIRSSAEHDDRALALYDPSLAAVRQLSETIEATKLQRDPKHSTWDAATRAMEVVDAVELSLQKGRTIEVFQQELTERLAFRGTMAAMGCGLLLLAFGAVVLVTLFGNAEGAVGRRLIPSWPLVLLAVLAFFLLLQTVPLLVHKSTKNRDA